MTDAITAPLELYRLTLSQVGKIRNRTEAHLVAYTQQLLAEPVPYTLSQIAQDVADELSRYIYAHPSHGHCTLSEISVGSCIVGKPHLVTRRFAIYGPGRGTYTLLVSETVTKDATKNYAPREHSLAPSAL